MMVVCAARSVLESNTKMGRAATYPTIIIIQKYIEAFRATSAETIVCDYWGVDRRSASRALVRGVNVNMASCAVELVEQHSRAACTAGTSYGCAGDTAVWTSCRGRFRCAGGPEFACGYPPGNPRYSCRCDGADDWLVASTRPRGARHTGARVAVCLFGQTRDHFAGGERSVHAQMRSTILNATALGVPVDVFVDTWAEHWGKDERGGRVDINWHAEFGKPLVALTVERTPPDASLLLNGLRLPTYVVREAPLYYSGTLPLLWKLRGCAAAIGRWENGSGFEYAAVLSARMDSKFWTVVVARRLVETTRAILAGAAGRPRSSSSTRAASS